MKLNLQKKKYATEDNFRKIISILTGMMSSVDNVASQCLKDYNPDETYVKGQICLYNNYVWLCKTVTTGAFEETKWEKQTDNITELDLDTIKTFLGLTPEQLTTMANLISTEIRLDKVFSSSETYTRIEDALKEAKQYCITELAKKSTGSFKIATSEAEVTDGNYLYLIMNPTTSKYDIHALVSGNVEKLTTVDVNLDNYFTKSEIEADFLKKADADSKYATITTVDDKVNKTDIVDNLTSTDTNKPLSANQGKALKDEVDLKANDSDIVKKTDIVTTIDSSSTNDTVPASKTVWDSLYKICDSQVLVDANNPTSKICIAERTTINTPSKEGLTIAEASLIISIENRGYWNGQISITMAAPEVYVRSVDGTNTWTKWRKLCSTNIKDVPTTIITNNLASTKVSLSNSDSYATYYVKNGTCYVTIWSMKILAACSVETIFNDLPKSAVGATCPLCNGEESFAQVFISPNSKVIAFNASATTINKNGYCSFSYPVAE